MSVRSPTPPPSKARDQATRILAELRRRREIRPPGWLDGRAFRYPTCDGGPEIFNITPRVSDLRKRHEIVTEQRGPDGIARYRLAWDLGDDAERFEHLVVDAREAARSTDAADELTLELFDEAYLQDQASEPPGFYDVDDAA
jgi:hypothetical protein